jgi:hypothetical protein
MNAITAAEDSAAETAAERGERMLTADVERSTPSSLRAGGQVWLQVADLLVRGSETSRIVAALTAGGVPAAQGAALVEAVKNSPLLATARTLTDRLASRDWMARNLVAVSRLEREPSTLDVRDAASVSREQFFTSYYARNQPVLLKGAADWAATAKWTKDYLAEVLDDLPVEVMFDRDSIEVHKQNVSKAIRRTMPMHAFLDLVFSGELTNQYYLVARNDFFASDGARPLLDDIQWPDRYIRNAADPSHVYLWLGPAGTLTGLHHDGRNNFFAQIRGRKRVTLYSPLYSDCMYLRDTFYSDIDCERPDLARFPLFARAVGTTFDLVPGDALFIPVGWWHHVRALDVSISLSFTDFHAPNEYESAPARRAVTDSLRW